jgi:CubicO group peptidase (beta-lactamase class C family)
MMVACQGREADKLDDEFELGSCTKAMTATLAAMLVEQGKLRWDMSLAEIFGESMGHIDPAWSQVTLLQLLHHTAPA